VCIDILLEGRESFLETGSQSSDGSFVVTSPSRSSRAHLQEGFVEDEGREKGQDMFDVEDSSVNRSMFELT